MSKNSLERGGKQWLWSLFLWAPTCMQGLQLIWVLFIQAPIQTSLSGISLRLSVTIMRNVRHFSPPVCWPPVDGRLICPWVVVSRVVLLRLGRLITNGQHCLPGGSKLRPQLGLATRLSRYQSSAIGQTQWCKCPGCENDQEHFDCKQPNKTIQHVRTFH